MAAVGAYESAFAATVPPPVIVANRTLLTSLIATNLLGQNSPAIAATEADYESMWAQDATAMYGYAATSATASKVTPFTSPPTTTDPAGLAKQGAAVVQATGSSAGIKTQEVMSAGLQMVSTLPKALEGFAGSSTVTQFNTTLTSLSTSLSKLSSLTVPMNLAMQPLNFLDKGLGFMAKATAAPVNAAVKAVESGAQSLGSVVTGGAGGAVSGAMGRAMSMGALSVPQAWTTTPGGSIGAALAGSGWTAPIGSANIGPASMPLMPLTNMGGRSMGGPSASRFELRPTVVSRSPAGG
jgi:PPE-repeat protein